MCWITLDNLKRFWKSIRTNPVTFTGEIDFQNTTRYKGNEIATKADVVTNDNKITVDSALSSTSTNPVQNKVINAKINSIIDNPLTGDNVLWEHLHRLGKNPILPTTNDAINGLGVFMSSFDVSNKFPHQPTGDGMLINIPASFGDTDSLQIWMELPSGRMYYRGSDNSTLLSDTAFKRLLDTDDAANIIADIRNSIPKNVSQLTNDLNYIQYTDVRALEVGKYLDLHEFDDMSVDFTLRVSGDGTISRGGGAYIRILDSGHLSINGNELWIE